MIARVVAFCAAHPYLVLIAAALLALQCELARRSLSPDVIPDLADPQIPIVAEWVGHPADEVASTVTKLLGDALADVAGVRTVRGTSMAGMAYVEVVFEASSHLQAGRQAVLTRVRAAQTRLPRFVRIDVGPVTSSIGWVFQYALVDPTRRQNAETLRRFHDTRFQPVLARIAGVAQVATVGGAVRQAYVEAKVERMRAEGIAFSDLIAQLGALLAPARNTAYAQLEAATISSGGASPRQVPLHELARIRVDNTMPHAIAELNGESAVVGGTIIAARGANLSAVMARVKQALASLRPQLPKGTQLVTVYDRLALAERVEHTLLHALGEEVLVVALVIVLFLMHLRSALIPLVTLPLVVLITFAAMKLLGLPATVMSLGGIGIALGLAVDAEVVALEACHRRLEALGPGLTSAERRRELVNAAGAFAPAILTSLAITALSFLPVFAFGGETGRLLAPLALSKTLVVGAAALVALTIAPALRDRLLQGRVRAELANPLTRNLVRAYRPFVHFALERPVLTLVTAALAVASAVPIVARLGGEFLPRIDEGDLLFMPTTLAGAPMDELEAELREQDRLIRTLPEVASVFGKLGRADTATDPAPLSMAETTIQLKPRNEWPKHELPRWPSLPAMLQPALAGFTTLRPYTSAELVAQLDSTTRRRGWINAWTAPARARLDMLSTGVRTPVAARIVAASPQRLSELGEQLRAVLAQVPGARNVVFESLGGQPWLAFDADAHELADSDVDPELARSTAALAIAEGQIGEVEHKGQRIRVRLTPDTRVRGPADLLRGATVRPRSEAAPVALGALGRTQLVRRPATVRSEHGALASYVHVDLTDRSDPVQYVDAARAEVVRAVASKQLHLAQGERIEWTGQYALMAKGQERLKWVAALVALTMLALLVLQFRSLSAALIVLTAVPFALVGSVWTLFLLDYPLSAPVWVGLLSVVGLAMQTAVVMVVYIDEAFHRRLREGRLQTRADIIEAHAEGTIRRLRPKIMTISTMAAALLPLLWDDGPGAEIMRRIAAPMLGGLATSAFLTLEVLPVLYTLWRSAQLRRSQAGGVSLAEVVGKPPPWARV